MTDALFWHRLQFGFTAAYHYLFPQLTMGLALLIVVLKTIGARHQSALYEQATQFWIRVFGLSFALGVVTGIPMEFQFGTNWSRFSQNTGEVIGQSLAMEGMFAFFLESTFLSILLWGRDRFGPRMHLFAAWALFIGSWASGYFIIVTNAFMQHPVGHSVDGAGTFHLQNLAAYCFNPWALVEYAHNMLGAVVTGAFVMTSVGSYYLLTRQFETHARLFVKVGVIAGVLASLLVAFPTGDQQGKMVARFQPVALAAMEGRWNSGRYAEISFIGQPNVKQQKLDNPLQAPGVLSFIAYGSFSSNVRGLNEFPADQWPSSIELLYYSFHIMVGLGTIFTAIMLVAALLLMWRKLFGSRAYLWLLMLSFPFPFIANTAGWMTAELGRQPWLVHGLSRTEQGSSPMVHAGETVFTSLGFAGLYLVLGLLYVFLIIREIEHGPARDAQGAATETA